MSPHFSLENAETAAKTIHFSYIIMYHLQSSLHSRLYNPNGRVSDFKYYVSPDKVKFLTDGKLEMKYWMPYKMGHFLNRYVTCRISSRTQVHELVSVNKDCLSPNDEMFK